ncbi:MAG TPA: CocE/NonD family hydrolase [Jatrophihabitantaceae bacterium]|nr:CocE/NonD family hydrolase [Jatrophihabitantaceae bacterium]
MYGTAPPPPPPLPLPARRRRVILIVILVLVVVVGVVVALVARGGGKSKKHANAPTGTIVVPVDGAKLQANLERPSGNGPFPLVVMPGSWTAKADEYAQAVPKLVQRGFEVLAYAQRGVGGSTGTVDFAGPQTQKDVSSVIDWALKNTPADGKRVAAAGISYGAAMSLLAAEQDPRIKTVVAMSGFTNFYETLAPNGAGARETLVTLLGSRKVKDRLTHDPQQLLDDTLRGDGADAQALLKSMSPARSADRNVAALNRNHTAVMLANAYQDSVVPSADVLPFYEALTGPKRLQMAPGDHGSPEATALQGQQNAVWDDAVAWLQRYAAGQQVDGARTGVFLTDSADGTAHQYASVAAMASHTEQLYLDQRNGSTLVNTAATGWTAQIKQGAASLVDLPRVFALVQPYQVPEVSSMLLSIAPAKKWTSAASTTPLLVNGTPTLHATVRPASSTLSFVAYLFDIAPDSKAKLMTYAPINQAGTAGAPRDVTMQFQPISWTVPAGHRIALVIDGVDKRFFADGTGNATIDATNTPVVLSLPVASS